MHGEEEPTDLHRLVWQCMNPIPENRPSLEVLMNLPGMREVPTEPTAEIVQEIMDILNAEL